MFHKNKLKT